MDENTKTKIVLPLLITKNFVLFPGRKDERIDVGRDFSVKAVNSSRDNNSSLLLIVSQKDQEVDIPQEKDIYTIGTLCRIVSYSDMKNYVRIRVHAGNRVKLSNVQFDPQGFYTAESETLDSVPGDEQNVVALVKRVVADLQELPRLMSSLPRTVVSDLQSRGIEPGELCDTLAPYLSTTNEIRQSLLEELNVEKRLEIVLEVLKKSKEEAKVDAAIEKRVSENVEKNQKDYILHEKLRAIKQELNEGDGGANDSESILEKLEKNPYPQHVKDKVKAELKRYEMMPQASLEASLSMSYIQTLLDVPWYQKSDDNDDLNNVKKILDEDHHGLTKVKQRIVEYLAVKKMTGNLKAPILCFYGPPGCGKTSLGKSIARALGRKFFKASLGGISDEAEIRGHRRTYVGSMPGRIIQGMRRAQVVNPVFLLDEIDKLASSYKGDPASALLEVLDPEQNFAFNDNYLEEPYDLSNVLFICTANYLDNIPAPLRDRLELIEVNSYTELEKLEIAKNFLYKKQVEANGLKPEQVSFTDDAYLFIIRKYTMEAGVRELERKIAGIIRKVVVDLLSNKDLEKVEVTPEVVEKYLGVPLFENTKKEQSEQVGVVTGLAYTQFGGDILPIEVTYFPGKGGLILTGKLGDVMKESASIALDYVRANAKKYNIDSKIFAENDIHIHVPEGAVPKDGPSAGVAITTAIISCLTNKPVDNNVAMTGEVTLRGRALPIGGLREKSLAALRSGIKTIIVPKENKKDITELPKEVKESLEIVFMENVDDAVKVAIKQ
jgi:ATP-dependent Lon protease